MPVLKPREPTQRGAYTLVEAAKRLGCHPKTVARWLRRGILREVSIPGGIRKVNARSVEALLDGKSVRSLGL